MSLSREGTHASVMKIVQYSVRITHTPCCQRQSLAGYTMLSEAICEGVYTLQFTLYCVNQELAAACQKLVLGYKSHRVECMHSVGVIYLVITKYYITGVVI